MKIKKNKIVAIVPIKAKSQRVKNKNFIKINKKPLYRYILDKLNKCDFDEVYIDSNSREVERYCKNRKFNFIKRLPKLAKKNANGNDLLNYHANKIYADIYFQIFVTAPLLKVSTINKCIKFLKKNRAYDSILTTKSIYNWFWFKNKPVNYNPKVLPRSQDAIPIVSETTGLYGIRRKALKRKKCRIGNKPFFFEVGDDEALDLDNYKDFDYLKFYVKTYLRSSKR